MESISILTGGNKMISRRMFRGLILATLAIIFIAAPYVANAADKKESGKEQKLSKNDLPAAVLAAFQKQYPNGKIKEVGKEIEDSTTYYEVESVNGSAKRNIIYSLDGNVNEIEEAILTKQLPDSAQQIIKNDYPAGKIERAEKVTKGDKITYEVMVETKKDKTESNFELIFGSGGNLIDTKAITEDEDRD
jgi:hypothetical protein